MEIVAALACDEDTRSRDQLTAAFARLSRTYELILHAAGEGIFSLDLEGRIAFANPAATRLLDWPMEDLLGKTACEAVHGEASHASHTCPLVAPILSEQSRRRDIFLTRTGTGVMVEYSLALIAEEGQWVGAVLVFSDITERERAERALAVAQERLAARNLELLQANEKLRAGEERYRQLVERSPEAILLEQDGAIVFANDAAGALYGAPSRQALLGRPLLSLVAPEDRLGAEISMATLEEDGAGREVEEVGLKVDGSRMTLALARIAFAYGGKPAIQVVARDISASKRYQDRLQYQATHDPLTGLPNRSLLLDRVEQAIGRARRLGGNFTLCYLDLDGFKEVNDSLGHDAGDTLLRATAQRLSACLRDGDTVARLGGDEFVLILADCNPAQAAGAVRRVAAAVSRPLCIADREVAVGCSIGTGCYPADGEEAESLLRIADAAMYQAKKAGRVFPGDGSQ